MFENESTSIPKISNVTNIRNKSRLNFQISTVFPNFPGQREEKLKKIKIKGEEGGEKREIGGRESFFSDLDHREAFNFSNTSGTCREFLLLP